MSKLLERRIKKQAEVVLGSLLVLQSACQWDVQAAPAPAPGLHKDEFMKDGELWGMIDAVLGHRRRGVRMDYAVDRRSRVGRPPRARPTGTTSASATSRFVFPP